MRKFDPIKVIYSYGNNKEYDFFIIEKKVDAIEIEINLESLAYKLDGPGTIKQSKVGQLFYGLDDDYVLEIRDKNSLTFIKLILASDEDVVFISDSK